MTEEEARAWISTRYGDEKLAALERYAELLISETRHQNLISPSTVSAIWSRHIADSAQLLGLVEGIEGAWIDVGTGAGLPGMVVAALRDEPIILVEPRTRRADFLNRCICELKLNHAAVRCCRIQVIKDRAAVISARAVAAIEQLFTFAADCAGLETIWLLPRGKSGAAELAHAEKSWQGLFHVEHSLTDPKSQIVIARGVAPK